jgi:hypothetical protein
VAKRSPILGYNHNLKYRGLIFHVQTEDSGVLSPHLFTHLFHAGVILTTRKLVYDAGSDEGAIKSLMQAQHKAVMKELRRGQFDDKIDEYLGGTEGLQPRKSAPSIDSDATIPVPALDTEPIAKVEAEAEAEPVPEVAAAAPESEPARPDTQPEPAGQQQPRTRTAERGSGASTIHSSQGAPPRPPTTPPPPSDLDGPTSVDSAGAVAAAIHAIPANATIRTPIPKEFEQANLSDSMNDIMRLELDDDDHRFDQAPHDTDVAEPADTAATRQRPTESVPPLPPPPSSGSGTRPPIARGSALPPSRPVSRPPSSRPAITPPQVLSRPITGEHRGRPDSDAVEVYAPAPPSVEPPPGAVPERPGQYSQHKRGTPRTIDAARERSGSIPVPSGLGRPGGSRRTPSAVPQSIRRETSGGSSSVPRSAPATRGRPPTPGRTVPNFGRTGSPNNSGVVMTRPAVIVGAPSRPSQSGRIRKAREDEGRGFGQGLISEKSLDEVILAYLSEDAEDK